MIPYNGPFINHVDKQGVGISQMLTILHKLEQKLVNEGRGGGKNPVSVVYERHHK